MKVFFAAAPSLYPVLPQQNFYGTSPQMIPPTHPDGIQMGQQTVQAFQPTQLPVAVYSWVQAQGSSIPAEAFVGGQDLGGEPMFVGRAEHQGSLTPGSSIFSSCKTIHENFFEFQEKLFDRTEFATSHGAVRNTENKTTRFLLGQQTGFQEPMWRFQITLLKVKF